MLLLGPEQTLLIGGRQAVVVERKGTDERPIIRLDVLRDRAAVEAVRGERVQARRDQAPDLPEDEWWAEDLEGCAVLAGAREIGVVKRLMALPSCEVLEVERADGGQELLVPLVSDAVGRVDVERGVIEIDLEFLGVGPER
jgi:16S rRNA processing protein RimM